MTKSVYEIITEKIIESLENGVVPWRKPWTNSNAVNWKTQKNLKHCYIVRYTDDCVPRKQPKCA